MLWKGWGAAFIICILLVFCRATPVRAPVFSDSLNVEIGAAPPLAIAALLLHRLPIHTVLHRESEGLIIRLIFRDLPGMS